MLRKACPARTISCPARRRRVPGLISSFALWAAIAEAVAAPSTFDVRTFGANGDGITPDTAAIQKAIDTCAQKGGGVVKIPAGTFVSGTVLLKDNVTLDLDEQAVLLGSTNIADYQAPDKFRSGNGAEMGHCFVGAVGVTNVGLTGAGRIDGRGKELLAARPRGNNARPFLARFVRCHGVNVSGVCLQGSAAWTMHFSQSRNVTAERVTIKCRGLGNNDGIDVDSSQSVRIRDCDIDTGDDAICLKTTSTTPCRDIEITGCRLTSHWAAIKFGTESMANFEDIKITDCRIRDTQGGGVKLLSVDGANLRNVLISDLTMEGVNVPVFIRLGARLKTFRAGDEPRPVGTISNVVIRNLRARAVSPVGILISGIPGHAVNGVVLENVEIVLPGAGTSDAARVVLEEKEAAYPEITMFGKQFPAYGLYARHVRGLKASKVKLTVAQPDARPAIVGDDVEDLELSDWKLPGNADAESLIRLTNTRRARLEAFVPAGKMRAFLRVEGGGSGGIELKNNSLEAAGEIVSFGDGVSVEAVRK